MDPELQALGLQLAEAAARNSASSILDRIRARKALKKSDETVAELEDIINELLSDKAELIRIAQSFEQDMVAQRISSDDVSYIVDNIIPVLQRLMELGSEDGESASAIQQQVDLVRPILSAETLTILQLVGFNFRKAIGEPLTALLSQLILSSEKTRNHELHMQVLMNQRSMMELALDAEAAARYAELNR